MSIIRGIFSNIVGSLTGPLAHTDPNAPKTVGGKPVIAAEYIYKSNPHGLMQQRYFVLFKNKVKYYKASNIQGIDGLKPNGEIKFKDVSSYEIVPRGSAFTSQLILVSGERKYTLVKKTPDSSFFARETHMLQSIITTYLEYKKCKKPNPDWVTAGSGKGLRLSEPSYDRVPLFDCEPILTQEQINQVPCSRVFIVTRAFCSNGSVYGLVFSNTGFTLIDPENSQILAHTMDIKLSDKKELGFNDRLGEQSNLCIRINAYGLKGIAMLAGGLSEDDLTVEVQARKAIADTYLPEMASMNPMHFLTQSQNIYSYLDEESEQNSSNNTSDVYGIASATRGKQLIESILPLKYDDEGEIVIPTMPIPEVSRELLAYRPMPFDQRLGIPEVDKSLIDDNVISHYGEMLDNVKVVRSALLDTQRLISGLLDAEKDFKAENYPTLDKAECANIINSIVKASDLKKFKDIFKTTARYWRGRILNEDSIVGLGAFRRIYSEYEDIYKTFYALIAQLQYHYEAVVINIWLSTFFRRYYTLAQACFDLPYKANEEAAKFSVLARPHVQSLRFLVEAIVRQYCEMNFKKNVDRFLPLSRDSEHLYMYELDTEFKMLEYEFVPELQAFRMITFAGDPVKKDYKIFMNHGYSICRTYNGTDGEVFLAGINNTFELVSLKYSRYASDAGRYATFHYSKDGAQHKFLCTFMTDNNRTTIGGTWTYDESTSEMVWTGPKFNTQNCYRRFHVDAGIPANVALFMATLNVCGKAEFAGSSSIAESVSQTYMRMLLNHIYLDNDNELQKSFGRTSGCYKYPEIVPYVPLTTHRIDMEYSKTRAIEWKLTTNLKKEKEKLDKKESKAREKEAELNKKKQDTIQVLQRIESIIKEGNELKKKAKGRAAELLRAVYFMRSSTRDLSPEIVNAETDENEIVTNLERAKVDLNYVSSIYDNITNTIDNYNLLPAIMPEPKPSNPE